jgi:alpha-D-xyloside xylohydrolase
MNRPIDWQAFVGPLDYKECYKPPQSLRRWLSYNRTKNGVEFQCQVSGETINYSEKLPEAVPLKVDVIFPDVLRIRMSPTEIRERSSEMLLGQAWPAQNFDLLESEDRLILNTKRLRVEFRRFPWRMRVFDASASQDPLPFFCQQVEDRAYGPAYEVAPIGFDRLSNGQLTVHEALAVTPGESFYGFGEKFSQLDKWGQELTSWATDSGNVSSYRSYKNIPFFMSSSGYGVFVHSSYPMVYKVGSESLQTCSFHILDSQLDYFLIYGPSYKHILSRYSDLTGHAPLPPKWSLGFWISRAGYHNRAEVENVISEMRQRGFPCDVLSIDPWWMGEGPWSTYEWDTCAFPDPQGMMASLRRQGVRTSLWIHPYLPAGTAIYQEAQEKGYLLFNSDHLPSQVIESFSGTHLGAIDFTNPAAKSWFQSKLEKLLQMGVSVFKTDFGEQAPIEAIYHDGRSGIELHNLYPLLYNQAVFELAERHFGRGLVWGRSGYAGSQRYPVQWGGDSYTSLDQLASQLRGLLSYGMSGVPFCSHDVGGFDYPPQSFDQTNQPDSFKDPETYIRWMQFGVFSSHLRAHGKQPHEPWTYGTEAERIALRYLKLRYRLLPYLYSEMRRCAASGLPMVAPLLLEYQDDPNTQRLDLQYLFGKSFLVAPIVTHSCQRKVYLPHGNWVDFWTRRIEQGGRWIEVDAPLEKIPLWVKAGEILPLGPEMDYVGEKPLDPLTLEIYYPEGDQQTTIYDEDTPGIPLSYRRLDDRLFLDVGPTPGQVKVIIYGLPIVSAHRNGQPLPVEVFANGQIVDFDGRSTSHVEFYL